MTNKVKIFFAIISVSLVIDYVRDVIMHHPYSKYIETIQYNYRNCNGIVFSRYYLNTGETIIDTEKKHFVWDQVK